MSKIPSSPAARRADLLNKLQDKDGNKVDEKKVARPQVEKAKSISATQYQLMSDIYEFGGKKNGVDENKAFKLAATLSTLKAGGNKLDVNRLQVARALIKDDPDNPGQHHLNGIKEDECLEALFRAKSIGKNQATLLTYIVTNGSGNFEDGEDHTFTDWAFKTVLSYPDLTAGQLKHAKTFIDGLKNAGLGSNGLLFDDNITRFRNLMGHG